MTDTINGNILDLGEEDYFYLTDNFIDQFIDKQPDWGPLGYVTYKRTYARPIDGTTEEFWQTLKRVVEGVYTIQKWHCRRLGLPFNGNKAQRSAQTMYQLIWDFKFSPSRGLWGMHLPLLKKVGSGPLFNCSTVSTKDIGIDFSSPFCALMDFLMLGIGVSCDTRGAGKVTIKEPKYADGTFVVDDTREGWINIVGIVLDAFSGRGSIPKNIDYSSIRLAGAPLKTMGGIAPGPDPLKKLIKNIMSLFNKNIGNEVNSQIITDLADMIGVCVVSGNIRRSAILMLGEMDDKEFMELKDTDKYPNENNNWRWASNNTVVSRNDRDYGAISDMSDIKGEMPGLLFIDNAKEFGRLKDGRDYSDMNIVNVNPCVTGDTMVYVADGRGYVPIKELADDGSDVPVFSYNVDKQLPEIKMMRNPRMTRKNHEILKITFDNGASFRCTGDDKIYMKDGTKKLIDKLSVDDSIHHMISYNASFEEIIHGVDGGGNDYRWIKTDASQPIPEHRFVAEFIMGRRIKNGEVVHHNDHNSLNNSHDNITVMLKTEHDKLHGREMVGENNPMNRFPEKNHLRYKNNKGENNGRFKGYHHEDVFDMAVNYSKKLNRRITVSEWRDYCSKNNLPFSKYSLGNYTSYGKMLYNASLKAGTVDLKNSINIREYKKFIELKKDTDMDIFFDDGIIYINKKCEWCGSEFVTKFKNRKKLFCSISCSKHHMWMFGDGGEKILNHLADRQKANRNKQVKIYNNLKHSLNREPLKAEWAASCKEHNVPSRLKGIGVHRSNDYCFSSYKELKESAALNFKILSIETDGYEDVYNGTVDDNHNYYVLAGTGETANGKYLSNNILIANCGEITLENRENCNIIETFPSRHSSYEEYQKTLKYAYLYTKTITLIPSHNMRTNAVMMKNRRIGISQSGIVQSFARHGRRKHFEWSDRGYNYLREIDKLYSDWLAIPRSKKITTVKPSGTISLLPGVTSGIHYPPSEYYYKLMRISKLNPIIKTLEKAGYRIEDLKSDQSDGTSVVYFPVKTEYFSKGERDVSIWEQLENAAQMQYWWSDNSVSVTIKFKDNERKDIKNALELYENRLKSVSFMSIDDNTWEQPPWLPISKEEYEEAVKSIKAIRPRKIDTHDADDKYCDGDSCVI